MLRHSHNFDILRPLVRTAEQTAACTNKLPAAPLPATASSIFFINASAEHSCRSIWQFFRQCFGTLAWFWDAIAGTGIHIANCRTIQQFLCKCVGTLSSFFDAVTGSSGTFLYMLRQFISSSTLGLPRCLSYHTLGSACHKCFIMYVSYNQVLMDIARCVRRCQRMSRGTPTPLQRIKSYSTFPAPSLSHPFHP